METCEKLGWRRFYRWQTNPSINQACLMSFFQYEGACVLCDWYWCGKGLGELLTKSSLRRGNPSLPLLS
jgi:hypothetical protein